MLAFKHFSFEAAHTLPEFPEIHGHSYHVTVWIEGGGDYVIKETEFTAALESVRARLDHSNLNKIIAVPTSENIARFIWDNIDLPLVEVVVERPSLGFGVSYTGDDSHL